MKIFRSRISFAPWLAGLVCVFAARAGLAQPSCLDSMPDPPFLASEPGLPACPVALQAPQPCSCAGTLAYCKSYSPSVRGDDAPAINACLDNVDCKCVQLQAATYRIRSPIVIKSIRMMDPKDPNATQKILDNARILGASSGTSRSTLRVESGNCSFPGDSLDSTRQRYAPIIEVVRTLNVTLDGFDLDVSDLRESCAGVPTRLGNFAIRFTPNVDGARITNLKVSGQRFGSAGYNGGGGTTGGIYVQTGANAVVQGNTLTDLGYLRGLTPSGAAAGSSGVSTIQIVNSASSCVAQNRLERIGFGIEVVNFASAGDSSKTQVVANAVEGAAGLVGCNNCSQGRVIKLQACRDGANGPDPEPLQDLSVRSNKACLFGGLRNRDTNGNIALIQEGSGIDLICGVQFSKFRSNVFDGRRRNSTDQKDSAVLFTLQTRSQLVDSKTKTFILGYSPKTTTHHNLFENNTAFSGRGGTTCDNNCADIRINADSPDQINIARTTTTSPTPGGNVFNNFLRLDSNSQSCPGSDFSMVTVETVASQRGPKFRFTTRGVRPMTEVVTHFKQGSTDTLFRFTAGSCAMSFSKRVS